jgi:hypothetical protein
VRRLQSLGPEYRGEAYLGRKIDTPWVDLATIDVRIRWVLEHPDMSAWLKSALRTALIGDPIDLTKDL